MSVQHVILAAGKGKRMGDPEIPKVLSRLRGRPIITFLLDSIAATKPEHAPVLVVGYKAEAVKAALGPQYTYALQAEQLGTAHAVLVAKDAITAPHVMVLNGDNPFVSTAFLKELTQVHLASGAVMAMGTVSLENFEGWRETYMAHGRIIRDAAGAVTAIREYKDATDTERSICEVNLGVYIFNAQWLFEQLTKIGNSNAQGEYYLTDVVALALAEGYSVPTVAIDPVEGLGINTKDHLLQAEQLVPQSLELILE